MNWWKKFLYMVCVLALFMGAFGCEQEGPAEKAGEKIDETMKEAGDKIEEAGDKVEQAMEK